MYAGLMVHLPHNTAGYVTPYSNFSVLAPGTPDQPRRHVHCNRTNNSGCIFFAAIQKSSDSRKRIYVVTVSHIESSHGRFGLCAEAYSDVASGKVERSLGN